MAWMAWDHWLAQRGLRWVDVAPREEYVRLEEWWEELLEGWAWPQHGTASTYNNHGCRCDACRAAWSAYRKEQRHLGKGSR